MRKKIVVTDYGITHYLAICFDCGWSMEGDPPTVRNEIRKHIRKTGHRVSVEKATCTHYELSEE